MVAQNDSVPPPPPLERSPSLGSQNSTMTANNLPLKSLLKHTEDEEATVVSPSSSSPDQPPLYNQRKRRVRFHKTIYNRRIPHLNDMSQSLRETIWIQPEEYLEIRQRCLATLKIMTTGTITEEEMEREGFCPRGLEGKTKEGSARRREYKQESIGAVLEEQNYQWSEELVDDEAIMEAYQVFTIPSAEDAYDIGHLDQLAIREVINEETYEQAEEGEQERPFELLVPSVLDKISNSALMKGQRAALLKEIEDGFFNEASLERRKKLDEAHSYKTKANMTLASSLREYFGQGNSIADGRRASKLCKEDDIDVPALAWDEEESSNCSSMSTEDSGDSFTTELSDVFHSRRRRQCLLEEIESYFVEPTIVAERKSGVSIISQKLSSSLNFIFGAREIRKHASDDSETL